jgi:toxin ParE1/3/4
MAERRWRVRLGAAAELDFANILKWTTENFGARQSRVYRNTIVQTIGELADGPDVVGSRARDEIMPGLRTLHVAQHGRRGSHLLMYRVGQGSAIEIVRILHDRMDLQRYVPLAPGQETEWRPAVPERRRKSGYANALWRRIGARPPMKMGTIRSP